MACPESSTIPARPARPLAILVSPVFVSPQTSQHPSASDRLPLRSRSYLRVQAVSYEQPYSSNWSGASGDVIRSAAYLVSQPSQLSRSRHLGRHWLNAAPLGRFATPERTAWKGPELAPRQCTAARTGRRGLSSCSARRCMDDGNEQPVMSWAFENSKIVGSRGHGFRKILGGCHLWNPPSSVSDPGFGDKPLRVNFVLTATTHGIV